MRNGTSKRGNGDGQSSLSAAGLVRQRTLKAPVHCSGIGLHSGTPVSMTLFPAPEDHGIVFRRTDVADRDNQVNALWHAVADTFHCTLIRNAEGTGVATVEHLMAALAGSGIDNVLVAIDGQEVPIMDGSSAPFVFLIECAGTLEQAAPRRFLRITRPVEAAEGRKRASLVPSNAFEVTCQIDFESAAVKRQEASFRISEGTFKADISRARTFGFLHEVDGLRAAGLAQGGSLDNAVVVSGDTILNEDGLRYDNEFARHKVLDCVGDMYLAGAPILGHFHGMRSGHALNNKLLRAVFADRANWEMVTMSLVAPAGERTLRPAMEQELLAATA